MYSSNSNSVASVAVLIFAAIAFAVNTFDIFGLFYLIADELDLDVTFLGLISATMVIGIGLFQIPAGMLAARYGSKLVAMFGMIVVGTAAALTGIASDIYQIAILRFILGGGLAFFFPSAIVLITGFFRKGSEALAVGTVTGANAAGGVIGLVVWAILAQQVGWRTSVVIGAALAIAAALAIYVVLPKMAERGIHVKLSDIRSLLTDKSLIIIGILLLASQTVFEQTLAFMPFYLQSALGTEPPLAGLVSSFTLIAALVGSPTVGWLYDKRVGFFRLIVFLGLALMVGVSINYAMSLTMGVISCVIVGFAGGGLFTLLSNSARESIAGGKSRHRLEYTQFSVNWVHSIALTGTFWSPILFSTLAANYSYPASWATIGAISFVILIIFGFLAKSNRFLTSS